MQSQSSQIRFDGFETGGGVGGGDGGLEPAGETGDFFLADFGGAWAQGEHFGGGEGLVDVEVFVEGGDGGVFEVGGAAFGLCGGGGGV